MFDLKWQTDLIEATTYTCAQYTKNIYCAINLVDTPTGSLLLQAIGAKLDIGMSFAVATLNLDHIVKLQSCPDFLAAYRRHSHVVADGSPVVWLRRLAGAPVEKVTGADLVDPLMALAAERGVPVGFLGSTQETLDAAAAVLERRHPGLKVVARVAPPFGLDPNGAEADAALAQLAQAGVRLCLLSLGAPKQEILAMRGMTAVPGCGFISVGAALDFIAGHQRRAPRWMRRIAMEWLWRMLNDPRRLVRRYMACFAMLPKLTWQAVQQRLRVEQD